MHKRNYFLITFSAALILTLSIISIPKSPEGPIPAILSTLQDSISTDEYTSYQNFQESTPYQDNFTTNLTYSQFFENLRQFRLSGLYAGKSVNASTDSAALLEAGRLLNEAMAWERNVGNSGEYFNFFLNASEKAYQTVLEQDSLNVRAHLGMATVLADGKGAVMLGVQELLAVSRIDSTNLEANIRLGRFAIMSGQMDKVIPRYQRVLAVDPNNTEALLTIGNTYLSNGLLDSALVYYTEAKSFVQNQAILKELNEQIRLLEEKTK